ncbi:cell division ATP-binding protein FtsE [Amaricoccus macauensis]|uniref:cell division ATP-binding protein FtsE n=1 Tax=Amaricoccus macauensis TaxID=57001 RepID=UPI003C7ADC90
MIEFEDVTFSFGQRAVLRKVNLSIELGSFTFLVGPSGAGKTTFLRLCYHDLEPRVGSVRHFGRRIPAKDRNGIADLRRAIGVVHQECNFLEHLPIYENIAMPLQLSGIPLAERADDLRALLEWVDLTDRVDALPSEMSGGERQRAAVARAVILSPEMILADEPTGNVDWDMAMRILTLFIELNRMGKTIFIATHDFNLIRAARQKVDAQAFGIEEYSLVPLGDVL